MKRLEDLTKAERSAWIKEHGVYKLGKLKEQETECAYIALNNSREEIAEWFKNATTVFFDKTCAPYFCTAWIFNSINEYLNCPAKYIVRMAGISQKKLAERFGIPLRTLEDWCAGKRQPPEYVLRMMCEILNIAF